MNTSDGHLLQDTDQELLGICGLNPTEQGILLFLLTSQGSSAGSIAKRTGIKRPTAYSALASLENQGLVVRKKVRGGVHFSTINPKTIPVILKNRARERYKAVEEATGVLKERLPHIGGSKPHRVGGYEISVIDSYEGVYAELERALCSGNFKAIFNPQTAFAGPGKEMTKRFLEADAREQTFVREIAVSGEWCDWYVNSIENPNHEVRQICEDQLLPIDITFQEDTAIITNYADADSMSVVMKHPAFCWLMNIIFDALWDRLPEGKPTKKEKAR